LIEFQNIAESKNVNFLELTPRGNIERQLPIFIEGAESNRILSKLKQTNNKVQGTTGIYKIEDARILGIGLVYQNDKLFYGDNLYFKPTHLHNQDIYKSWRVDVGSIKSDCIHVLETGKNSRYIEGNTVILTTRGIDIYGHWLIDILPRIAIANKYLKNFKYLLPKNAKPFGLDLLHLFGVKTSQIEFYDFNTEFITLESGFLITQLRFGDGSHVSKETKWVFDKFKKGSSNSSSLTRNRKIYLSRSSLLKSNRLLINSSEIEATFVSKGFEIVNIEKLTLLDQFKLIRETSILAGEFGSAMHNSLFGSESLKCIVLQHNNALNFIQLGLCSILNQEIGYVIGESLSLAKRQFNSSYIINNQDVKNIL